MSQVIFCDLCPSIIKPSDKRYYIAIIEAKDNAERGMVIRDIKELMLQIEERHEELKKEYDAVKIYELCPQCKKVYDYVFQLRKDKVEALKEEANRMLRPEGDKKNE